MPATVARRMPKGRDRVIRLLRASCAFSEILRARWIAMGGDARIRDAPRLGSA
jgi:hypothetical protein